MDGPQPTESKIARDEGFIIRTRVNTGRFSVINFDFELS